MSAQFTKLVSLLKPKRRWAQFSLGTMLLVVTALCVWLADYVSPVRRLERQLRDPDEDLRELAAARLGYMGAEARSTKSSLLRATDDTSAPVRLKAVWALSRVTGRADVLAALLEHQDHEVRLAAVEGMLWNGADPAPLVPVLLELNAHVATVFEALGPNQAAITVPVLLDSLSPEDEIERQLRGLRRDPAANALNHIAIPAPVIVPALIERLGHERPEIRTAAAEQLLRLGASAKEAAPALRARMRDHNPACAAACAAALGAVDPDDPDFLLVLKRSLRSDDFALPHRVRAYLWMLGPAASGASDDLVGSLCDLQRSVGLPFYDMNALKRLGPPAVAALDRSLKQSLAQRKVTSVAPKALRDQVKSLGWTARAKLQRDVFSYHRDAAARSDGPPKARRSRLGKIARGAKIRVLKWELKWASVLAVPDSRWMTPSWLGAIGPPARPAVPSLIAALDDPELYVSALAALEAIGKDAAPAAPRLLNFLDSGDERPRVFVLRVLGKIGGIDDVGRARLRPFLASNDRDERAHAACALAASGEPVEQILPTLLALAADRNSSAPLAMGMDIVASIASLGPAAVPHLVAALEHRNPAVRTIAAKALGKIGPEAREAVPILIRLLDDGDACYNAAEALGRIGPPGRAAVPKLIESLEALRSPPDPSDYDPDEHDLSGYDWSAYDAGEYLPLLSALRGIGVDAREAVPVVLRLAYFDDADVRHAAVLTLANIEPSNSSLVPFLRRWLAECERKSATENFDRLHYSYQWFDEFAEAVRALGPRAEELAPDLERLMASAPLIDPHVRCYAAFALTNLPAHRRAAEDYLHRTRKCGFFESFDCVNLADTLLQRIDGVQQSWTKLGMPHGVGP